MKLKLKILFLSLGFTVILGSLLTVIIEYTMSIEFKQQIDLAEKEEKQELENKKKIESENLYQEQKRQETLNKYDNVGEFYNGVALVKKDDKYGYIDEQGREIIQVQYDMGNNFSKKNYAKVKKDDKFGYIDNKGNEIIPIIYSYCGEVYNDFVAVGNGGKYGFISINDGKKICELIYDKVEAFGDNGLAKVVLNQKFGYIDKTGKEIVPIEYDYTEENYDFTGEWKATDIHSSKAGSITISGQIATSFNFEILAKYFSKTGTIVGTADIIKPNVAEYKYTSRNIEEIITFSIIDEKLIITAKSGGNCGMDNELIVTGTYTLDTPKYTNDKVMTKVFNDDEEFFGRIKTLLGEDIYSEYFLYGFKNGEYKYKKIDDASAVMKGKLYTVTVPTMKKDFKLFISDENKIYFFAKHEEIYITDDLERQSIARKPSVIAFDEL